MHVGAWGWMLRGRARSLRRRSTDTDAGNWRPLAWFMLAHTGLAPRLVVPSSNVECPERRGVAFDMVYRSWCRGGNVPWCGTVPIVTLGSSIPRSRHPPQHSQLGLSATHHATVTQVRVSKFTFT